MPAEYGGNTFIFYLTFLLNEGWLCAFKSNASDCEWDKMSTHDAVKLTVYLHTGIDKPRDEILVKDIMYES